MGRCYSLDFRERVAVFVADGASRRAAARRFGVSESFAVKLMQRHDRHGSPAPVRQGRPPGSGKLIPFEAFLIGKVETQPDITMPELAKRLMVRHTVKATPAMLSRFLCQRGFTHKKALLASECERADIAVSRRTWTQSHQPRMRRQPGHLVFIDV